jgi:hypothetical protein
MYGPDELAGAGAMNSNWRTWLFSDFSARLSACTIDGVYGPEDWR